MDTMASHNSTRNALLGSVQEFLTHEAWLLDERRFNEWLELFDAKATYWVPVAWRQSDPVNHVSLIYETRDLLEMRLLRLMHHGTASQFPPARTSRLLGNTQLLPVDSGSLLRARSTFTMVEYRRNEQRLFAGFVTHDLQPAGDSYRIQAKRVDLLNCDSEVGLLRFGTPF